MSFSAIVDASNATGRLYDAFTAELLTEHQVVDKQLDIALKVENASFTWDAPPPEAEDPKKKKKDSNKKKTTLLESEKEKTVGAHKLFKIDNVSFDIPRGSLVAFVGPVGSGKSSILQGLIGEMRKTGGNVTFGGSVGYCSQSAWIQVGLNGPCASFTVVSSVIECHNSRKHMFWTPVRRRAILEGSAGLLFGTRLGTAPKLRYD